MAHRFQGVAINSVHIILQGVPVFVESGFLTALDDVDSGNTCIAVNKKVVVRYGAPSFFYEIPSVTQVVGCVPYLPVDAFGKFFGIAFVEEGGVFGPHHVKKNTKRALYPCT